MKQIEVLREKLNNLISSGFSLNSDEVIKISQELDKLISIYSAENIKV